MKQMSNEQIALAVRKYERTIKGTPTEAESQVRYFVTNGAGHTIFETHDPNQAEGVRMKTIGSRVVTYDPIKVISNCQESLEPVSNREALTEDVEESDYACPVCEAESDSDEFCTECGAEMADDFEEDDEDADEDEDEVEDDEDDD